MGIFSTHTFINNSYKLNLIYNYLMKLKVRVYALFQFFSFLAFAFLMISFLLFTISSMNDNVDLIIDEQLEKVFTFHTDMAESQWGSVLIYIALILIIITWVLGLLIFRIKDRNFFDSMFLLFLIFPVVSNLFCLLAQLSLNVGKFTPMDISKEEIELEKTKVIELVEKEFKIHGSKKTK